MERFNLTSWFVDRHLEEGRGDRTALLCGEQRVTYAELAALVNRAGHVLRELGVRQEERVLLALSDGVEFVATWYAAQKIGAVTAEVYTFLPVKDFAYYLDYTRAGVVVADASTLDRVREARAELRDRPWPRALLAVGVAPDELQEGEASFDALVADAPAALDPAPTTADDIAIWKFTTGSTGMPKACVHRMQTPLRSFEHYARGVLDIREDDVVLPVPKLFFGYARDLAALYPFGVGAAGIVFAERSTPERMFELIAEHRPTILVNVPTMIRAMLEQPDHDLSCLRLCTSAGEALPQELHRRWTESFGVEVLDGIGSSEAYHIYISNRPGAARPGTLGQVVPGYSARVVDEDGSELPDDETGRAVDRGRHRRAHVLGRAREVGADLRGRRGHERRPLRARRRRLLPLPRPRRRHAQGRRHLGGPAGDRAVPRRARRRGRVRGRRLRGGRPAEAAGLRRRARRRDGRCRGAAGPREGDAVAAQVPARRALRRRAAPDRLGKIDRRALREVPA